MRLEMHWRREDAASLPVAVWRAGPSYRMLSSGVVGGGLGERAWVLNAQVPGGYDRMDPAAHIAELAAGLGLAGDGVGLLTAASVTDVAEREDEGVLVAATVGLRVPTWAAAPSGSADREFGPIRRPGTINIIVSVPVPLGDAAYVNAVITATEAKTQALLEAGVRATGTASDAVCIAAPAAGEPQDFAGPRSVWGARIARAVHAAVLAGARQDAAARRRVAGRAGPESIRTDRGDALPGVDRGAGRPVEIGTGRRSGCEALRGGGGTSARWVEPGPVRQIDCELALPKSNGRQVTLNWSSPAS